jgi:hypothetical protein
MRDCGYRLFYLMAIPSGKQAGLRNIVSAISINDILILQQGLQ